MLVASRSGHGFGGRRGFHVFDIDGLGMMFCH
jgi:hypothetical protein